MKLINKLRSTTSPIAKQKILDSALRDDLQVFYYALHPYFNYGVRTFNSVDPDNLHEPRADMYELLDKLVDKRLVGLAAREAVESYAQQHGDLIKLIILGDLACGVQAKTINKVYPGYIPQFKVQLAKEVPLEKLVFPMYAQIKYDGVRIIITKTGDNVAFITRNGKPVPLPAVAEKLKAVELDFMLDTEVTLETGKMVDRTSVSGLINSAMHGGMINSNELVFNCFDTMSFKDFAIAKCPTPYFDRLAELAALLSTIKDSQFRLPWNFTVNNPEEAQKHYQSLLAKGYEGAILKTINHKYSFKRSPDWAKLKDVRTADLRCVGYEAGRNKYEGAVGALLCHGTVDGYDVLVSVGSGLTDAQRFVDDPDDYIGKTIEVKYNSVIRDKASDTYSLFLPRFVGVRIDK